MSFDTKERVLKPGDSVIILDNGLAVNGKVISQSVYADRNWIEVNVNGIPINYECHMVVKVKAKAKTHHTPPSKSIQDKRRQKKKLSIWKRYNWQKL
jgi:hypothetical protein